MDSVDTLIMGRETIDQVLSFGQWPYGETPVIVLSRNQQRIPPDVPDTVPYTSEQARALINRLTSNGVEHFCVDGGATIQSFLSDNLLHEVTLTVIPLLLG